MLLVTVELISARDGHREVLGVAHITNDATGTLTRGDYDVTLYKKGTKPIQTHQEKGKWRRGRVRNFPRQRLNAWDLLLRALMNTVGERM